MSEISFDEIWNEHIVPLAGQVLRRRNGETNTILEVNSRGLKRLSREGNESKVKIEVFRWTVNRLIAKGVVEAKEVHREFPSARASAGVMLVLAQVPYFEYREDPSRIVLRNDKA